MARVELELVPGCQALCEALCAKGVDESVEERNERVRRYKVEEERKMAEVLGCGPEDAVALDEEEKNNQPKRRRYSPLRLTFSSPPSSPSNRTVRSLF